MKNVLIIGDDREYADFRSHGLTLGGLRAVPLGVEDLTPEFTVDGSFDIVIFDIYSAATDIGLLCRELRTKFDGPTLVMYYENDERFILNLYNEGIAEYILKPIGLSLMLAKITSWLHSVSVKMHPLRHARDGFRVDALRRVVETPEGQKVRLSKLEYHLFQLLYRNRGRVLPTDLLVDRIWGQFEEGDSRLKHLVLRLRRKIEPDPRAPIYIETYGREGYHFSARI